MRGKKTIEDYLKTIYILSKKEPAHACMVAEILGVSRPTVSVYLKRLEKEGYLTVTADKELILTEKGLQIAEPVFDRHKILQDLLVKLGVEEEEAHRDACEMEHGLGEESYQALKKLTEEHK